MLTRCDIFPTMTWTKLIVALAFLGLAAAVVPPTVNLGKDVNGKPVDMPLVGAGTWQYNDSVAYDSVCKAFGAGYNMVDTAHGYGNEKGVGQAIQDCWFGAGKAREDLFVMTKLEGGLNTSEVLTAHAENMEWLQLDYVDHLMSHFPADWYETPERSTPERRQEEWLALESVYNTGAARSIGISHYCSQHIDDVMEVATVKPSVNQVEYHVGSGDIDDVIAKCAEEEIYFMSFSPLCGPCTYKPTDSLIDGDLVTSIAANYSHADGSAVAGSQIALRWIVQQALPDAPGYAPFVAGVIPKSDTLSHIESNADLFDFELSREDMERLSAAKKPRAVR